MYEGCTLGIDIGTHGSKGAIVTKDGVVLGDSCCTHNLIIPRLVMPSIMLFPGGMTLYF